MQPDMLLHKLLHELDESLCWLFVSAVVSAGPIECLLTHATVINKKICQHTNREKSSQENLTPADTYGNTKLSLPDAQCSQLRLGRRGRAVLEHPPMAWFQMSPRPSGRF